MTDIPHQEWPVILRSEFDPEFDELPSGVQNGLLSALRLLGEYCPQLGRPHVERLAGSRYANMKELRVRHRREPWRFLFALDTDRGAVVLTGGNKAADARFYERRIAIADGRFERHLAARKKREKPKR